MRGKWFAIALVGALITPVQGSAQALNGALAGAGTIPGLNPNAPLRVLPVRGNIYMLLGDVSLHYSNSAIQKRVLSL